MEQLKKDEKKRTAIQNSCLIFFRGCVYDVALMEKKNHERDGNHQYLRPKLTDEKPWLKLLCGT